MRNTSNHLSRTMTSLKLCNRKLKWGQVKTRPRVHCKHNALRNIFILIFASHIVPVFFDGLCRVSLEKIEGGYLHRQSSPFL